MKDNAVADMIGTLTMLIIAIALFSIVYYFTFSIEQPDETYEFSALVYGDEYINIEHYGGESVPIDNIEFFIIEDSDKFVLDTFNILNSNDNNNWEIGEILSYESFGHNGEYYLTNKQTGNIMLRGEI